MLITLFTIVLSSFLGQYYQAITVMDELNKRIVEIMVRFNHSKSSLATELGVSLPLITHITSGRNKPGIELLQRVLLKFPDIDPYWLLLGQGNMFKDVPKPVDVSPVLAELNQLKSFITSALDTNTTMLDYHKLLLNEVLHLQEMSIKIRHSSEDLVKLEQRLDSIQVQLREIGS